MMEVPQALALILAEATPRAHFVETPTGKALGAVLAADIASDIDSPPHDKSVMDGFAVRSADCASPGVELEVIEQVTAGQNPQKALGAHQATRIMTGAPIPQGADAVVMVEKTETFAPSRVRILQAKVHPEQNIARRGQSMRKGECVLRAGKRLRAADLGLLAEVGRTTVKTLLHPAVSIVVTGNELVPADQKPGPGQIRNSNGPMLAALALECGIEARDAGIAIDDEAALRNTIAANLRSDVLLLSGGVSEGVADLVPRVLAELGVRQVFHKVNLKPGKPIWFGLKERENEGRTLVFGLPGNPVSSLVCFQLFVRPALEKLAGREPRGMEPLAAQLATPFHSRGDRPTYWPGKSSPHPALEERRSEVPAQNVLVEPLSWQGSGDLRTLTSADCLLYFPPGHSEFPARSAVTAYRL
jgi:molybdopterin molybdotransferase